MSEDLQRLESWVAPLLQALHPTQRRQLARRVGQALRRRQQQRIASQRAPDGTPYAPRRTSPLRSKGGRIKRQAMFAKLRQARHLRVQASASEVAVGFSGRVARIARIHQEGRTDSVRPGGPRVTYARRPLLGFTAADEALVRELLLEHLQA